MFLLSCQIKTNNILSLLGELLSATTRLEELGMADKGKLELQVSLEIANDLVDTGPPPNTRSHDPGYKMGSHDPGYRMGSVLTVEVDSDDG